MIGAESVGQQTWSPTQQSCYEEPQQSHTVGEPPTLQQPEPADLQVVTPRTGCCETADLVMQTQPLSRQIVMQTQLAGRPQTCHTPESRSMDFRHHGGCDGPPCSRDRPCFPPTARAHCNTRGCHSCGSTTLTPSNQRNPPSMARLAPLPAGGIRPCSPSTSGGTCTPGRSRGRV